MPWDEDCGTAGFGKTERPVGWEVGLRAKGQWREVDPRFADVRYLRSWQSSHVSPKNCGKELFNEIVEALMC